jgi:uncharacterized protein
MLSQDCSSQTSRHIKNSSFRWIVFIFGWVSIVAGVIGLFLPVVPTVPFLLLAAACFARSSERFHSWLVNHTHLGPLISDYLVSRSIPLRARRLAICMVWISFPSSAFLFVSNIWLKVLLISVAIAVTLYLMSLPTSASAVTDRIKEENNG